MENKNNKILIAQNKNVSSLYMKAQTPIKDIFESLEQKHKTALYRKITVSVDNMGKKYPVGGDHNDWTSKQIASNRGSGNTYSFSTKHAENLYVIDIDTKELDGCELYNVLNNRGVGFVETNKGYHYYVYIKNLDKFSGQQKVYRDETFEIDLLKITNCWETTNRVYNGTIDNIQTFNWHLIKQYFNTDKMNIAGVVEVNDKIPESIPTKESDTFPIDDDDNMAVCNSEEFTKLLYGFKPKYGYNEWLKVGMICYNNFEGADTGLELWIEYTKKDKNFHTEHGHRTLTFIMDKYKTFEKYTGKKSSYKQFIRWNIEDYPCKNKYEQWYKMHTLTENMNKECMFHTKTQDIIIVKDDYYFRAKQARNYYSKFEFFIESENDDKKNKKKNVEKVNPYDEWLSSIDRRDISDIIFDPTAKQYIDKYNIWKGYKYVKTEPMNNVVGVEHFLDHIKNVICDGNMELTDYVLNWFAQIIQQPYNKTKVGLVWRSEEEGVGKNIILNLIEKIIGDEYYYSTSNLEHLIGNFNADAEAKILINMNECLWGGDKKKEGRLKEFITEDKLTINQKGVKTYNIDNYANVIITTNSDWIIGINGKDRRWQMIECGGMKYEQEYYTKLANTPIQQLANYFYNRDISNFQSTKVIKTELHEEQVELNMDSVEIYWKSVLTDNMMCRCKLQDGMRIKKSQMYEDYQTANIYGSHCPLVANNVFWKKIKKYYPTIKFNKKTVEAYIEPLVIIRGEYNKVKKSDVFDLTEDMTDDGTDEEE